MLILDTNHVDAIQYAYPRGVLLKERLRASQQVVRITIITVQENLQGWLSKINSNQTTAAQSVLYYSKIENIIRAYGQWNVLPFDDNAANVYTRLKALRIPGPNINDLKIAAIALCHNATVLTADTNHFRRIDGLDVDDWLLDEPSDEPP